MDRLVAIRRAWDRYIVPPGTSIRASPIPPWFVMPPPPANRDWAVCLQTLDGAMQNT
jgi:hypothetical protein